MKEGTVITSQYREQHGRKRRWSEHVSMHQLPARLLLGLLQSLHLIVGRDIFTQGAQENHRHHARQEEYDHDGVKDGEDMDLVVGVASHINVPTVRPWHVRSLPLHIVSIHNLYMGDITSMHINR